MCSLTVRPRPTLSARTASFPSDRPCTIGSVSMGVPDEAGILTSSPCGAIDHPSRSPRRRRPATVPGKTRNDPEGCASSLADLGGIENDRNHFHPASASGTGQDVQFVHLGQQPCPGFPAGARADVAVQWPALGLILRIIRGCGRLSGPSTFSSSKHGGSLEHGLNFHHGYFRLDVVGRRKQRPSRSALAACASSDDTPNPCTGAPIK